MHGNSDISLSQGRGIIRAVTGHGNQLPSGLIFPDQLEFSFRSCLRQKIVYTGFGGNSRGSQGIISGDHNGFDPHLAQLGKPFFYPAFDNIF